MERKNKEKLHEMDEIMDTAATGLRGSPEPVSELETNETSDFKNFAQLFPVQFHVLKELVSPIIQRQNTNYLDCISVGEPLMITLRFLSTVSGPNCTPPPADAGVIVKGLPENDDPILPDILLTFSCDDPGKYLNGSSVLICGKDGQWDNPFPSCEDITCEAGVMPPHLNVAGLPPANETMKIGHKLQFSCDDQYTMEGSAESECLQTGQWSAAFPTCAERCKVTGVSDGVLLIPHVRVNQLRKGEKLTFWCRRRGDFLQGKAVVTCLADGQWSDPFPTCGAPLGCGRPPSLLDGDIKTSLQFQYRHNDRVEYICQNYYTMEGQPYKTCINGEWTGQMRCLKPCTLDRDAMNAHNIAFRYTHDDKLYSAHNDEIEFMCKRGRTLVGRYGLRQKCVDGVIHLPTCQ